MRTDSGVASFFEPGFLGFRRQGERFGFAIHARASRRVELDLYELGSEALLRTVDLDPDPTAPEPWMLWTADLAGLPDAFDYVVRVDGGPPLLDPYAKSLAGGETWGRSDDRIAPGVGRIYRSRFHEEAFDWEGVERPRVEASRRIIYELHVRGFTAHPSAGVTKPGTYPGLSEKLAELVELGVTTVELLPVFEFDETENRRVNPLTAERLLNFWGYSPVSFFAPKAGFASTRDPGAATRELKELVRELHRAGLEVILDVVYNHTAEGEATGPLHAWRGLDAAAYYLLDPATGEPLDLTGCGNTVHTNHPVTRRMIHDSLRHWADEYRVDGFRFDLAAVFFRGESGAELDRSELVDELSADSELAARLLVAEPWDAAGFRPACGFAEPFKEWDGEFRDGTRRLVGGLDADPRPLARRLAMGRHPSPARAVRFVACHDGRTLADVVAYAAKHNQANGEENRDGWDGEVAWNGGVEGPAELAPLALERQRQIRLLWSLLAAAPGTLQLSAGDERLRTQRGNNNAWCQDNETGWIDWTPTAEGERLQTFVRRLLALRRELVGEARWSGPAYAEPYESGGEPAESRRGAFLLVHADEAREAIWLLGVNAGSSPVRFPLPVAKHGRRWRLRLDTAQPAGQEIFSPRAAPLLAYETTHLAVAPGAARILVAWAPEGESPS